MNKLIPTKIRVFISLVGPSETEKLLLIYNWLKTGIFKPTLGKIYFFHNFSQLLHDVMQNEIENLEFKQGVNFELIHSFKTTVQMRCYYLMILVKRLASQKPLLTLPPLGDIGV